MFSVNIDKLATMSEEKVASYNRILDIIEAEEKVKSLSILEGGLDSFRLAFELALREKKVLFMDGDFTSEYFLGKYKLGKNLKGIADYIRMPYDHKGILCLTNNENMKICFSGNVNDGIILEEEETSFKQLLEKYKEEFDYIIMDSNKENILFKYCDAVSLVVYEGNYDEEETEDYFNELRNKGCRVLGVIIKE